MALVDLPAPMLDSDSITFCDSAGLVEFATVGPGDPPKPFFWHSCNNAGYKPWATVLPDVRAGKIAGLYVRITAQGRAELAKMRLGAPTGPAMEAPAEKPKPDDSSMSGEERAVAVLTANPEWSDTRIARRVGVSRTTLYDYQKFMKLRALLKDKPEARDRRRGRTGKRIADTFADTQPDTWDEETL